jgi:hypothetical protein
MHLFFNFKEQYFVKNNRGHEMLQLCEHSAITWTVTSSLPNGVTGIFHWQNPSGHPMTLEYTHSVREMSTRNFFWV